MTIAVCLKCGRQKVGALTACAGCGFEPIDPTDKAKALLLIDRFRSPAELSTAATKIAHGESIDFDADLVQALAAQLPAGRTRGPIGCQVAIWSLVALMVLLVGFAVWLWFATH